MPQDKAEADKTELRLLVGRVLTGDEEAFGQIFTKWQSFVRRLLRPYCSDEDSTDEAVGEVFYPRFHEYIRRNGEQMLNEPKAYLARIAITHGINIWRKTQRELARTGADANEEDLPGSSDPGKDAEMEEIRRRFQIEVNKLPAKEREAVILIDAEGNSYEEAASIMKAPIGSVKGWVFRGRRRLQTGLSMVRRPK